MSLADTHEPRTVLSLWKGSIPIPVSRKGITTTYAGRVQNMREIVARVAWEHNISVAEIMGQRRFDRIVRARQAAMWRIRQEKYDDGSHRYSFPYIGAFFGKDHTTVMSGCDAHAKRMAKGEA